MGTGLKESVKSKLMIVETEGAYSEDWADGYIKELEEAIHRFRPHEENDYCQKCGEHYLLADFILKFLRGDIPESGGL